MFRFLVVPALVLVLAPSTTFGQLGGAGGRGGGWRAMNLPAGSQPKWPAQRWLVKVETAAGKKVLGTLTLAAVPINCDLGHYYIKAEHVKEVRFAMPNEQPMIVGPGGMQFEGVVVPREGDEIDGSLAMNNWTVETDLGQLTLFPAKLKSVTFIKQVESPKTTADEPVKAEGKIEEKAGKK